MKTGIRMKKAMGMIPGTIRVFLGVLVLSLSAGASALELARAPLFIGHTLPPNVLLIPDTSESMQEGLDGRLALDHDNPECQLGPNMDPVECPAGARNPDSKASIVKRISRTLADRIEGNANLGLMSYQQEEASRRRNDAFFGGTVRWRLTQRVVDARFSTDPEPDWYDPDYDGAWDSDTKRFRDPHPTEAGIWVFYNVAVPGYQWEVSQESGSEGSSTPSGEPEVDLPLFLNWTGDMVDGGNAADMEMYRALNICSGTSDEVDVGGGLCFSEYYRSSNHQLVDSLRQRGIDNWGQYVVWQPANQLEWRSTTAPGLGYLHVPIGGLDEDGEIDEDHWQALDAKLQPQRHDWDDSGNPMTDPDWPLIAAGLTPLEGTMLTARDYFLGDTDHFGSDQGNTGGLEIPRTCSDDNDVIWITDGLPSVASDGTSLGDDPKEAVAQAEDVVRKLYEDTAAVFERGVRTHVVGFGMPSEVEGLFDGDNPLDRLASAGGTGSAHDVEDEEALERIMDEILARIIAETRGSAASVAANSTRLDADTMVYQAMFDSSDWSGDLIAFSTDEETGEITGENWRAAEQLDEQSHNLRRIYSWDGAEGKGIEFRENEDAVSAHLSDDQVAYLRGYRGQEEREQDGIFRNRSTVLGDIVNSDPAFAHDESYGYIDISTTIGTAYRDFMNWKESRPPMIYVGANDGMLHGFHADTGENLFSYAPGALIPELGEYTDPDYAHRYYVDGAPTVADAYIYAESDNQTRWRTVLVGTMNAGGRTVFGLDIRDPENFDEENVLWEFSHEELGEGVEEASIVRMEKNPGDEDTDHKWVAIFGNGYNSESQTSQLFAVNVETGELLDGMPIDTGEGNEDDPNGMAAPFVADTNGDRNADTIYAGDLHGHLWKFELDGSGSWQLASLDGSDDDNGNSTDNGGGGGSGEDGLLFFAEDDDGNRQPITAKPQASLTSDNDIVVLFGTGKYLEADDAVAGSDPDVQSLYGIMDRNVPVAYRGDLLKQEILTEGVESGTPFRITTENLPEEDEEIPGWRLDLVSPSHGRQGELVMNQALVSGGIATFSTVIPEADDPCGAGGDSWVLGLDAETGARPGFVFFDIDGDGEIDEDDLVEVVIDGEMVEVPASGIGAGVGVAARPTTISTGSGNIMYISGSDSEEPARYDTAGDRLSGRQGWRQVR